MTSLSKPLLAAAAIGTLAASGGLYYLFQVKPVSEIESAVRGKLKDPDSAKFTGINVDQGTGTACGLVNAKNSMGGYIGDKRFVFAKGEGVTFITPEALPKCMEPSIPRLGSVSISNPLAASAQFEEATARYTQEREAYLACAKSNLAILQQLDAKMTIYSKLCPDKK